MGAIILPTGGKREEIMTGLMKRQPSSLQSAETNERRIVIEI
jgi:hypothetical protein